jgi:hypothetical protein
MCRVCEPLYVDEDLFVRLDVLEGTCVLAIESDSVAQARGFLQPDPSG